MKVTISVPGTFHAFHLGKELEERGALGKIYTTHPRFKLSTTVSRQSIQPIRHPEVIHRVLRKIPGASKQISTDDLKRSLFDKAVSRKLNSSPNGIFVGFSGSAFSSLQRANKLGLTSIVERCSSHIRTQARILDEEYKRNGFESGPIDDQYIRREENEYEEANYIVVPSDFVYSSFVEQGVSEEKLIQEPYGVNTERYTPAESGQSKPVRFLFAGRIGLRKGVQYLLDAWKSLDLEDAELWLAGAVEESGQHLADRCEGDDSIRLLGWVDDMAEIYHSASAFVLPTLEEGSAYVTYEAMASGIPIVTTAHSGWVGQDGEHGFEIPTRDADALASAMQRLYENESERAAMGTRARERAEEYSWTKYGERIFERYCCLADVK